MDMHDNHILDMLDPAHPKQSAKVIYAPARVCEKCLQTKAIEGNFLGDNNTCRVCVDLMDQQAGLPVERKALGRLLDSIDKGHSIPHATDTLASMMRHMGGANGVGRKLRHVYDMACAANDWKVAARILQTVIQTNVKVSDKQQDLALETMTKDELREYLKSLYGEYVQISLKNPLALEAPEDQGD